MPARVVFSGVKIISEFFHFPLDNLLKLLYNAGVVKNRKGKKMRNSKRTVKMELAVGVNETTEMQDLRLREWATAGALTAVAREDFDAGAFLAKCSGPKETGGR